MRPKRIFRVLRSSANVLWMFCECSVNLWILCRHRHRPMTIMALSMFLYPIFRRHLIEAKVYDMFVQVAHVVMHILGIIGDVGEAFLKEMQMRWVVFVLVGLSNWSLKLVIYPNSDLSRRWWLFVFAHPVAPLNTSADPPLFTCCFGAPLFICSSAPLSACSSAPPLSTFSTAPLFTCLVSVTSTAWVASIGGMDEDSVDGSLCRGSSSFQRVERSSSSTEESLETAEASSATAARGWGA